MLYPYNANPSSPPRLGWWIGLLFLLIWGTTAQAVQVQDIVRIKGQETSQLVGVGLVVGLNGTGDGGEFAPAHRTLAELIATLMDEQTSLHELEDVENVALVTLSAELPATGVREGDRVDVHISSIGPAESLAGGRLFLMPMTGPTPGAPVFAMASGRVTIEDAATPTQGLVTDGAQLVRDVPAQFMDRFGRIHLVLHDNNASWPVANNLANLINGLIAPDGPDVARAVDPRNVIVEVPEFERPNPASFISQILQTYLDPSQVSTGARVVINEATGTIVMSGDVQISPVIISHQGLTITAPAVAGGDIQVPGGTEGFVAVDPEQRGGARLADLLAAFNQLEVPAQDRIEIIRVMEATGKLHAEVIYE
jgi:flagellar P-ring protein precursor FlgI